MNLPKMVKIAGWSRMVFGVFVFMNGILDILSSGYLSSGYNDYISKPYGILSIIDGIWGTMGVVVCGMISVIMGILLVFISKKIDKRIEYNACIITLTMAGCISVTGMRFIDYGWLVSAPVCVIVAYNIRNIRSEFK